MPPSGLLLHEVPGTCLCARHAMLRPPCHDAWTSCDAPDSYSHVVVYVEKGRSSLIGGGPAQTSMSMVLHMQGRLMTAATPNRDLVSHYNARVLTNLTLSLLQDSNWCGTRIFPDTMWWAFKSPSSLFRYA